MKQHVLFLCIFLLGFFFRTYQLEQSIWLQAGHDESRDMLVASHILNGELVSRGPLVAGGLKWLMNSPVYFYFLASLWALTYDPAKFMYLWATLSCCSIFIGYFIGKRFSGETTGLIIAALITLNPRFIFSSRELLQTHLLLPLSLGFIASILFTLQSSTVGKSIKNLCLVVGCLLLPLHFHYGVLVILPVGALWVTYLWIKIFFASTSKKDLLLSLAPLFIGAFFIGTWIVLSYRITMFDQVFFLIFNFEAKRSIGALVQLSHAVHLFLSMTWGDEFQKNTLFYVFLIIITFFLDFVNTKKNLLLHSTFWFFLITTLTSSFFLLSLYSQRLSETYLLSLYPFFVILIGIALSRILKNNKALGSVLFSAFLITQALPSTQRLTQLPSSSSFNQQRYLAELIVDDYRQTPLYLLNPAAHPKFLLSWYTTTRNMPFDGWGTSGVWFHLEKILGRSLVLNTNYGVNYTPIEKNPRIIYMVCDSQEHAEVANEECLQRFMKSYPVEGNAHFLGQTENLSLWRANVSVDYQGEIMNVVHREFLE